MSWLQRRLHGHHGRGVLQRDTIRMRTAPHADQVSPDQARPGQETAQEVIGEMARLLGDTRGSLLAGGGVLSAITIGIALEAAYSVKALRFGRAGATDVGLLCVLLFCWLTAVTLLAVGAGQCTTRSASFAGGRELRLTPGQGG